jgi:hypothetical protein
LEAATDVQVWMLTLGLFMVRSPPRIDLINS